MPARQLHQGPERHHDALLYSLCAQTAAYQAACVKGISMCGSSVWVTNNCVILSSSACLFLKSSCAVSKVGAVICVWLKTALYAGLRGFKTTNHNLYLTRVQHSRSQWQPVACSGSRSDTKSVRSLSMQKWHCFFAHHHTWLHTHLAPAGMNNTREVRKQKCCATTVPASGSVAAPASYRLCKSRTRTTAHLYRVSLLQLSSVHLIR
jgi:hypothetical protein